MYLAFFVLNILSAALVKYFQLQVWQIEARIVKASLTWNQSEPAKLGYCRMQIAKRKRAVWLSESERWAY